VIRVASTLDYEHKSSHEVTVTVSDGVNSSSITFTINVLDVDESTGEVAAAPGGGGGGGGGGCTLRRGAEFDPILVLWLALSVLYLWRRRMAKQKR